MKPDDVLPTLLARLAAAGGEATTFSAQELVEWPADLLAVLKIMCLLSPATPASSVTCPGCEDECAMPVEIANTAKGETRAFVACDKRDDTARVPVPLPQLEQWQCTPRQLADALAATLKLRRPLNDTNPHQFDLGMLKGTQYSAQVELLVVPAMQLHISGHVLPLTDVLELDGKGLTVERRVLVRCVDNPIAAAGGKESAQQRRERIQARAKELKAQGEHAYIKALAAEEGLSRERIKQLLKEETAEQPGNWFNLLPKGTTQKKPKPQR
jgi:hypothetical protein